MGERAEGLDELGERELVLHAERARVEARENPDQRTHRVLQKLRRRLAQLRHRSCLLFTNPFIH